MKIGLAFTAVYEESGSRYGGLTYLRGTYVSVLCRCYWRIDEVYQDKKEPSGMFLFSLTTGMRYGPASYPSLIRFQLLAFKVRGSLESSRSAQHAGLKAKTTSLPIAFIVYCQTFVLEFRNQRQKISSMHTSTTKQRLGCLSAKAPLSL